MSDSSDPMDASTALVKAADVTLEPIGARALLVDRDVLLVPDPPPLLVEPPGALVAVIVPVPEESGPVERIGVADVEHLVRGEGQDQGREGGLDLGQGGGEPPSGVLASVVRLAGPSRYVVRAEPATQRRLAEALRIEDGDLWAAMRELGYDSSVPARPRKAGPATLSEDRLDALAAGPCRVIRTCLPHPPHPDTPHSPTGPR
ncbi:MULTISPECIES: hypothetical protein [Streptomyces]|uniref:Uncharacterized protein n=1 Tax=Streptomyces venezuelae TaxID=54571 RepID=A0A5P2B4G7_STRVZ|nr:MULTISPECIES: hypothetical protein [Streptomyces]MYY83119.1 hypothetical protein [Streptomyces sp. SID335]MYZ17359.1 hypothetical protein [Streptomyces sp. SID337]NDZ90352.1 hypothetical protein [Streptomyces sp. SID10115]NEB44064.1 hypothetical protein [Streptomyces sp. SID339]QES25206.1 hypothetical protein DEJ47_00900 [Streptomyces venezuelae]